MSYAPAGVVSAGVPSNPHGFSDAAGTLAPGLRTRVHHGELQRLNKGKPADLINSRRVKGGMM